VSKQLTLELIAFKTKTNQLDRIKNLNLVGNDIGNIAICSEMEALEVLSLSVNSIRSLEPLQHCYALKELYIRRNCIESLEELEFLKSLPNLRTLWLDENPVASIPGYRLSTIKLLRQLDKLDNVLITEEERIQA